MSTPPPIRSFVIRQGRITPSQKNALTESWIHWGIDPPKRVINFSETFGRNAPIVMDLGFGMGDSTLALAAQNPETNYLAVDVHNPGIGRLLAGIQERQLTNIRVLRGDIAELLAFFPNECLSAVLIYFPDPWPKARHHKRRLIQPQFLMQLARAVQPMGLLHIATDWENYAQHCLDTLTASPFWENTADSNFIPRPSTRPLTKFERRGQAEGRLIRDLLFRHICQTN